MKIDCIIIINFRYNGSIDVFTESKEDKKKEKINSENVVVALG